MENRSKRFEISVRMMESAYKFVRFKADRQLCNATAVHSRDVFAEPAHLPR